MRWPIVVVVVIFSQTEKGVADKKLVVFVTVADNFSFETLLSVRCFANMMFLSGSKT